MWKQAQDGESRSADNAGRCCPAGKRPGFTLIELPIAAAIIAIPAAIGVLNFLKAQVRSKVARVKADIHGLSSSPPALPGLSAKPPG